MTALAHAAISGPADGPDGTVPAAALAAARGCSPRHARRLAARLARAGLACKSGGSWAVAADAPGLGRDGSGWTGGDRAGFASLTRGGTPPARIEAAVARREILARWRRFDRGGRGPHEAAAAFFAGLRVDAPDLVMLAGGEKKYPTLQSWCARYRKGGLAGLVPGRRGPRNEDAIGPDAWAHAAGLLNSGNGISAAAAYVLTFGRRKTLGLDADPAWRLPSLRTFQRECAKRRPKPLRIAVERGDRAFNAQCVPKQSRDYDAIPAGDEWVGDVRTLDLACRVPGARNGGWRLVRSLKFTAWMDVRSRMIVGWHLADHANSATIAAALVAGLKTHGLPRVLRCDWGKDFRKAVGHVHTRRGDRVLTAIDRLGIEVLPVEIYSPWSKPIERLFDTLKDTIDRLSPAFIGGCPVERHPDRYGFLMANLHLAPTLEQVCRLLAAGIDGYHREPHGGCGMYGLAPGEAIVRFRAEPPRYESPEVLDALFRIYSKPRLVRRDGVRLLHAWYGWGDPRLIAMQGKKVVLALAPDDAGAAWVCDADAGNRPLFAVRCERWAGRSVRDAVRAHRIRKRLMREGRSAAAAGRAALRGLDPERLIADRAAGVAALHGPRELLPPGTVRARPQIAADLAAVEPPPPAHETAPITLDEMSGPPVVDANAWGGSDDEEQERLRAQIVADMLDPLTEWIEDDPPDDEPVGESQRERLRREMDELDFDPKETL